MQGNNAFSGNYEGKYQHGYSLGNKWSERVKNKTNYFYLLCFFLFFMPVVLEAVLCLYWYWFERGFQNGPFCLKLLFSVFESWLGCLVRHHPFLSTFIGKSGHLRVFNHLVASQANIFAVLRWGYFSSLWLTFPSWFRQCIYWPVQGRQRSKKRKKIGTCLFISAT